MTPTSFDTKKVLDYLEKRNALGVRGNSTKKGSFKEGGTYEHTFVYHAPPSFEDGVIKITEVAPRPSDAELDTLCPNKDDKQDTECRKERMPYTAPGQGKQWESKNIKRAVGDKSKPTAKPTDKCPTQSVDKFDTRHVLVDQVRYHVQIGVVEARPDSAEPFFRSSAAHFTVKSSMIISYGVLCAASTGVRCPR